MNFKNLGWFTRLRARRVGVIAAVTGLAFFSSVNLGVAGSPPSSLTLARDPAGIAGTYNAAGPTDSTNPFFLSLGTNGRSCSTCHLADQAMTFTPGHARRLYEKSEGRDPLFANFDGANCQSVSAGDRAGHSLILGNGLIRIPLAVPANAEFSISVVHDPYGCALQVDPATGVLTASVYRRPLPTANLSFLSAVMFDGRETVAPLTSAAVFPSNLRADLAHQAIDATTGHARATAAPADSIVQAIVNFELGLYTGQMVDREAGLLDSDGALGGPINLSLETYYPGINDTLGADPNGLPFTPLSMHLYDAWNNPARVIGEDQRAARADIAAGEALFNNAPMTITSVRGLNDNSALGKPPAFAGHCATCHDTPNIGDHSLPLPLDIGTGHTANLSYEADPLIAAAVGELSAPDLPVFLITGCPNPFPDGGPASFYTTDPGKALITGHCSDFNRIKGPILRALAARAPYFHNGAAANLRQLVRFYNKRFQMALTDSQQRQLVAFLNTL